jgi:hypothetical protein
MNDALEQRLRAHYADRAVREPLAGSTEPTFARPVGEAPPRRRSTRFALLGAAAAIVALAGLVAVLLVATDDDSPTNIDVVDTGQHPETTAPVPTTTLPTTTVAPTTTIASNAANVRSVVASVDGVLGWWDGSHWRQADAANPAPIQGGETYTVVGTGQKHTTVTGSAPGVTCEINDPEPALQTVDLGFPLRTIQPVPIALIGVEHPQPRPVVDLPVDSEVYRQAAAEVLAGLGVQDPDPRLVQVVRTDLEGDGVDEVFVVAQRLTNPASLWAGKGDYSVVFVRRVVDAQVVTTVPWVSLAYTDERGLTNEYIVASQIAAIADLNGDGRMEVAVGWEYYEGSGTSLFELTTDGFEYVIGAGCGL